jgi:RHS repeat-associated protein
MTLGNTLIESTAFNKRLQPTQINVPGLFTLDFTYDPPDPLVNNNGNIHTQQIRANAQLDVTQTYTYDGVNRLSSATEGGWQRDYYYDAFGNRAVKGSGVAINYPQCALATDPGCAASDFTSDNRLSSAFAAYDDAGNQTVLKYPGNPLFSASTAYDANNKQRYFCDGTEAACPAAVVTGEYRYDAAGNRVEKIVGTNTTTYVYNAFGQVAAEYETAPPTMGREPGRFFRTTDHLGSTRLVTRADGTVKTRRDFFPFGEEILANATYGNRNDVTDLQPDSTQAATYQLFSPTSEYSQQFTGQQRDDESGLDYFSARFFGSSLGRFTSPDAPFADQFVEQPQSWNLYAYVRNRPLSAIDPSGRETQICGLADQETGEQQCQDVNEDVADQVRGDGSYIVAGGEIFLRNDDGTQGQQIGSFNYLDPDGELSADAQEVAERLEEQAEASNVMIALASAPAVVATSIALADVAIPAVVVYGKKYLDAAKKKSGREITFGPNLRIAPFGNHRFPGAPVSGRLPHYHRRFPGPGGSIKRHRPWDPPGVDRRGNPQPWWKRF